MIRWHASWVLPIAQPPIRDGWVAIDDGRIVGVGSAGRGEALFAPAASVDLGAVALLPGLVNAHTHLELSYLRGRVPGGSSFVTWIRAMISARRGYPDPQAPEILAGVDEGIAEATRCGTAAVGDISNTMVTCAPLAQSNLDGVVFSEIIGFNPPDAAALVDRARDLVGAMNAKAAGRASLAAHAPYSVAPAVLRAIAEAVVRDNLPACSIHLSESVEEVELLRSGGGPWRRLLEDLGAWNPAWQPPASSAVHYLDDQDFLTARTIAVHGVQMTPTDLDRLVARGTTLVTCPRSNLYTGAGTPPVAAFYASGVRVAVGTDSLASAPDLNLFLEVAALRRLAPGVTASRLLDSATRQGARALGLDDDYGSIAPGRRARLIAVAVPPAVDDVEEYLVSGIHPEQIRWIE